MPNGDHDNDDGSQRTFKEVMEEVLRTKSELDNEFSVTEDQKALVYISVLSDSDYINAIINSSDVPPKAVPFVEALRKLNLLLNDPELMELDIDFEETGIKTNALQTKLEAIKASLNELVEASEVNEALKNFSEIPRMAITLRIRMYDNMVNRVNPETAVSGLDDLFDGEENGSCGEECCGDCDCENCGEDCKEDENGKDREQPEDTS